MLTVTSAAPKKITAHKSMIGTRVGQMLDQITAPEACSFPKATLLPDHHSFQAEAARDRSVRYHATNCSKPFSSGIPGR